MDDLKQLAADLRLCTNVDWPKELLQMLLADPQYAWYVEQTAIMAEQLRALDVPQPIYESAIDEIKARYKAQLEQVRGTT